jgi:hypothetical protein
LRFCPVIFAGAPSAIGRFRNPGHLALFIQNCLPMVRLRESSSPFEIALVSYLTIRLLNMAKPGTLRDKAPQMKRR